MTCQKAFDGIKQKIASAPRLKFPNFEEPFEIHMDASDYAIGRLLLHQGKRIAFENKKLSKGRKEMANSWGVVCHYALFEEMGTLS